MEISFFQILVTRDTTESALIPVAAESPFRATQYATSTEASKEFGHLFKVNEENLNELPYMGSPEEDIMEISEETYVELLAQSKRGSPARRKSRIVELRAELQFLETQEENEALEQASGNIIHACHALISENELIRAIKLYRRVMGCRLLEARNAVKSMSADLQSV